MNKVLQICFVLSILFYACASDDYQFSQLPEFREYYKKYPPRETEPTVEEKNLLHRFRPRFFLADGQEPFIDFYQDYITYGYLVDEKRNVISSNVDHALLNKHKNDPDIVFIHTYKHSQTTPVVYGRVDYDGLKVASQDTIELTFLTYNIVFRWSGLPAGLSQWKKSVLDWIGSVKDWHQLDHYVLVTLALNRQSVPVAATMQQHNYQTTYIFGKDIHLPPDGRIKVDIALSSNEMYPHSKKRTEHRAVQFLNSESVYYLITGDKKPLLAGNDITHGTNDIEYRLKFLPQGDAFYRFQGKLGESRRLPGRDGPPGADYNTIPALKPKATALVAFYRREDDMEFIELLKKWDNSVKSVPGSEILERYTKRFIEDLRSVSKYSVSKLE